MNTPAEVPAGDAIEVPVEWLSFDLENPRFTEDKRPASSSDVSVLSMLYKTADLSELIQSISTSGYINIEPLIVHLADGGLTVLEGNRRLAAIKALRDPGLASASGFSVPKVDDDIGKTLENILVYRVEHRDDARAIIGFKHINGPQAWDAFAKASYAAKWLRGVRDEYPNGGALQDIADRMGDKHATIHRMVTAYFVLKQAESRDVFRIDDRYKKSFSFSHLYTGISYEEFCDFLGMAKLDRDEDPLEDPVPEGRLDKLSTLMIWLYGSKSEAKPPVIRSQNPDLKILRRVLASNSATLELEQTGDLTSAEISSTPKSVRFSKNLVEANMYLKYSMESLDGFDPDQQPELLQIAETAQRRMRVVFQSMRQATSESEEEGR